MRGRYWRLVGAVCLVLVAPLSASGEVVVYENTTNNTGGELTILLPKTPSGSAGNEVTLAGTERFVSGIDVLLHLSDTGTATFDLEASLRTNVPPDDRPFVELWYSGRLPRSINGGPPVQFHVDVPYVEVPDTTTVFIRVLARQGALGAISLPQYYPPTVGTVRFGFWRPTLGPQQWDFTSSEAPFWSRITARASPPIEPIPTIGQWGLVAMVCLLLVAGSARIRWARARGILRPYQANGP